MGGRRAYAQTRKIFVLKAESRLCLNPQSEGYQTQESVASDLSSMVGHHLDSNAWLFDYRTDLTDELCRAVGIDLSRRTMTKSQMNRVMGVVKRPRS